jgi:hypothetical protein
MGNGRAQFKLQNAELRRRSFTTKTPRHKGASGRSGLQSVMRLAEGQWPEAIQTAKCKLQKAKWREQGSRNRGFKESSGGESRGKEIGRRTRDGARKCG